MNDPAPGGCTDIATRGWPPNGVRWRSFLVESERFAGTAEVLTFAPSELLSTKIRALYQRRKGRDLFDLWLALTVLGLRGGEIVSAFWPSRPDGLTAALAEANDTSIGSASLPTFDVARADGRAKLVRQFLPCACLASLVSPDLP